MLLADDDPYDWLGLVLCGDTDERTIAKSIEGAEHIALIPLVGLDSSKSETNFTYVLSILYWPNVACGHPIAKMSSRIKMGSFISLYNELYCD